MKIWLQVLITVLITAGVAGGGTYYFANAKATKDKDNLQVQIDELGAKLAKENINSTISETYTNTKYGFQLTLNDLWLGYKWQEIPSTSYQTSFIRFYAPTVDPNIKTDTTLGGKYANIFNIVIYTLTQWAAIQAAGDADAKDLKANNIYLTKNSNYVFAYTRPTVTASDLTGKDFKISAVAASFGLTQ
ncbi:MAG: hypothetical protein WC107_01440 [Patescibacteria group bacterium]